MTIWQWHCKTCSFLAALAIMMLLVVHLQKEYDMILGQPFKTYEIVDECSGNKSILKPLECNCTRSNMKFSSLHEKLSSCDYFSTMRGQNQNVVSFSFYGNTSSIYFQGVEQSIMNVKRLYPGWVMRLYHNIDSSDPKANEVLCALWCKYEHLDLCDSKKLPFPLCDASSVFGMIWRFFTLGDHLVERFIIRDLDSPILQREVDAVDDWIRRNKSFHIMRDHPYHALPILGGMWGAWNHDKEFMQELRRKIIVDGVHWGFGEDQDLLVKIIWPYAINDSVAHDSYCCQKFQNSIPFPSRRENLLFVGMIDNWRTGYDNPLTNKPCPTECRPTNNKDWIYC